MIDSKSEKARLDNDANEVLPVFIWEKLHTSQIRKQAEEIYELTPPRSFGEVRQFFTFDGIGLKGEFPWKEGKTVLCFRGDGAYPAFYSFDFIEKIQDFYYIFSRKNKNRQYERPFTLSGGMKKIIKQHAAAWAEEDRKFIKCEELKGR